MQLKAPCMARGICFVVYGHVTLAVSSYNAPINICALKKMPHQELAMDQTIFRSSSPMNLAHLILLDWPLFHYAVAIELQ